VKFGVTAPDLPVGGWVGTVSQVRGEMCLVAWSEATQRAVRSVHRRRLKQIDIALVVAMWLPETALQGDPGEPLCIERTELFGV
jgi:hypothetical protein